MKIVKEFKDLGLIYVVGDIVDDSFSNDGSDLKPLSNRTVAACNVGRYRFDDAQVGGFAWRPLNTLPENPKFKFEQDDDKRLWRPLLDQSVKLLNEDSLSWKISNIGNVLHNISCSMTADIEQDEFAEYAITCWSIAKELSNKMEKVDFSTVSLPSNSSDSPVRYDKPKKYMNHSKVKPVFTQAMAEPSIGFKLKFNHDIDGKFSRLYDEKYGWEDGDDLEVIHITVNHDEEVCYIVLNCQPDVLNTAVITDLSFFDTRTPKQKAVDDIEHIVKYMLRTNETASDIAIAIVDSKILEC